MHDALKEGVSGRLILRSTPEVVSDSENKTRNILITGTTTVVMKILTANLGFSIIEKLKKMYPGDYDNG